MVQYSKLDAPKLGLAAGIVWAVIVFLTTLTGMMGYSRMGSFMATTMWGNYGYAVSPIGSIIGAIIGFVYAFVITWIIALLYNKFLSN